MSCGMRRLCLLLLGVLLPGAPRRPAHAAGATLLPRLSRASGACKPAPAPASLGCCPRAGGGRRSASRRGASLRSCRCAHLALPTCAPAAGVRAMGDCVPAVPPPSFCDMVTYNVTKDIHTPIPDPHNVKDLDDIAKDIYFTAIEVRLRVVRVAIVTVAPA
jgi:hypothetical protein